MRAQTTILSLLLVLGSSVETAPPQERTALEGTWLVTSLSLNGQVYSGGGTEIAITIAGNTYEQSVNGQVNERGTITVDPSMIPMRIDFLIIEPAQTTTQLGIVEITGDTLKLHLNMPGANGRPADFNPLADHFLLIAKKK